MSMPIVHVVGARPQFVKAAAVLAASPADQNTRLVHTGQHYDANLSDVFFTELGLRAPDYNLGIGSGSHGVQTGQMLIAIEAVLQSLPRGVMVVYGDTNSTVAAALAASKLHWPVVHIEAGLRSFDRGMPEEINRIATDHISDLLLCPVKRAIHQLHIEGLADRARFTGDVMLDIAQQMAPIAQKTALGTYLREGTGDCPGALMGLPAENRRSGGFALATVHRAANTDSQERLHTVITTLGELPEPVVLPLHPRTAAALRKYGITPPKRVHCIEPVGYLEFSALLQNSARVFTDSGGVQKEALFASRPCVTLRDSTEWTETLADGWNVLVDADRSLILEAAHRAAPETPPPISAFGDGQAALHTARAILEMCE